MDKGAFVKIAVNHEVVQLISEEGNCVDHFDQGEVAEDDDSFDGCMYSQLGKMGRERLGCTVPWLPDKSNICTEEAKRVQAFELYQNNRRNQVLETVLISYKRVRLRSIVFVSFIHCRRTCVPTAASSLTCTSGHR